jgi:putative ABC transport system permease protein
VLKAAIKSLFHHKARLAFTALSIVLGVAFIAGTFIYTDTTAAAFDDIFDTAFEGVDVIVTSDSPFQFSEGVYFDASLVDDVASVPGVESAFATLQGLGVQIIDQEGEPLGGNGPPTFAGYLSADPEAWGPITFREGGPPVSDDQIAIDASSAEAAGHVVGDTVSIVSPVAGPLEYSLVGVVAFGDLDNLGGATFSLFDLPTTQMVLGQEGKVDGVQVQAAAGTDINQLIVDIQSILPEGAVAQSAQTAAEEQAAEINEALGFFNTFLLVFAFVALFVGTFIIYNTFRIVIVQRLQELALMRALGSTRRQVLRIVLLEAAIIGALASVLGIFAGILLAFVLRWLFGLFGIDLPAGSLVLAPRTVVVALVVGIGVTLISSFLPAVQASRIPPVAALGRRYAPQRRKPMVIRAVVGVLIVVLGVAQLAAGLFADISDTTAQLSSIGLGAVFVILGVYVLSALFAIPASQIIGAPFAKVLGAAGKLAQRNAGRSPRRVSATAAAIMVGIALISLVAVMAASIRGTIDEIFDSGVTADLVVTPTSSFDLSAGIPPFVAGEVAALPEVQDVSQIQQGVAIVRSVDADGTSEDEEFITGVDDSATGFFAVESVAGVAIPSERGIVVDPNTAESRAWLVGSEVEMLFEATGLHTLTVEGIVEVEITDGIMMSRDGFVLHTEREVDSQVYVQLNPGVTEEEGKTAVGTITDEIATVKVQTLDELQSEFEGQINGILNFFTVLLALTVIIALIGVTNTMSLAVFERRRELGLLRAVGLSRPQTAGMVLTEASIISAFGATLGVLLGIAFAWAILQALSDQGLNAFVIPYLQLIVYVLATSLLAVIFAIWPARRASKLNILEAIAYE